MTWRRVAGVGAWTFLGLAGSVGAVRLIAQAPGAAIEERALAVQLVAISPLLVLVLGMALLLATLARAPGAIAAGLAGILACGVWLGDRFPRDGAPPSPAAPRLTVMTVNLRFGHGDAAAIARAVRQYDVDVLALQESGPGSEENLARAGLASALPYRWGEVPSIEAVVEDGAYATTLWSRVPVRPLGPVPGASRTMPRLSLTPAGGPPLTLTIVHTLSPTADARVPDWRRDLAAVGEAAARTRGEQIVLGDFNAAPDNTTYRQLLRRSGLTDAASAAGRALTMTWAPLGLPVPLAPIDHVLTSLEVDQTWTTPVPNSDHRGLVARLAY